MLRMKIWPFGFVSAIAQGAAQGKGLFHNLIQSYIHLIKSYCLS